MKQRSTKLPTSLGRETELMSIKQQRRSDLLWYCVKIRVKFLDAKCKLYKFWDCCKMRRLCCQKSCVSNFLIASRPWALGTLLFPRGLENTFLECQGLKMPPCRGYRKFGHHLSSSNWGETVSDRRTKKYDTLPDGRLQIRRYLIFERAQIPSIAQITFVSRSQRICKIPKRGLNDTWCVG